MNNSDTNSKTYFVLPLRNTLLFPGVGVPLHVGRPGSVRAVEAAMKEGDLVLAVAQRAEADIDFSGNLTAQNLNDLLFQVGTLFKIESIRGDSKAGYQILARGTERVSISKMEYLKKEGAVRAEVLSLPDKVDVDSTVEKALLSSLKTMSKDVLALVPGDTGQLDELVSAVTDLSFLSHMCASNLPIALVEKQNLLEMTSIKSRVLTLLDALQKLKEQLQIQNDIRGKMTQKLGKTQRDHILREQLNAIREELGEGSEGQQEYSKKIEDARMPEEAKKVALEEFKRLEAIGTSSPESHVIRNYLDLLCSLPWNQSADSSIDLVRAREILEADHYGLAKIKTRIIQHLSVLKLKNSGKGSILLFVGPPGVGKTSLGQSIAQALGRKFVRASLGGVRDDSEIRGHRRTYIGSMPGRIIQGIKRAGENNPVFMLDEMDKLANSFHGDPAAALLEVLDPEQNGKFMDHYLDVPFDLSKVFFIATANTTDSIPAPLLDRMEVIEVSGYTTAEKLHIVKSHLVPKELKDHGLSEGQLQIADEALLRVINNYTREAGVRGLQRRVAELCRYSAEKVLAADAVLPIRIGVDALEDIIGVEPYVHEVAGRITPPGVVTGLAWTPMGGDILFIESSVMPGTGKLTLTGQLGDVMKESAQIALSLVRSQLGAQTGVAPSLGARFENERNDLHIHVPAGATPKDGPSAGVTLLTALASLLTGRAVDPKLAMTGEITLRGNVMPVGGIKEKVIAAHRAGVERIILSRRNQKDLKDVPSEVMSQMKFEFVDQTSEVLALALGADFQTQKGGMQGNVLAGGSPKKHRSRRTN